MTSSPYATYRAALSAVSKPCALLDVDAMWRNADRVLAYAGDKPVRLGTKSIRCVPVLRALLARHDRFRGLLCYTASEAVWLAGHGFDDLLVAYPTWDAAHIRDVARALEAGARITLMADSREHLQRYSAVSREYGDVVLPVCLDLDMGTRHAGLHFGALRSPLLQEHAVLALCEHIAREPSLRFDGLMGYEAQLAGTADAVPGQRAMNLVKRALKRRSAPGVVERRARLVAAVRAAGHTPRFVNAGGSGSLRLNASEAAVTEVTAGSAFYGPVLFEQHRDYDYEPAAAFAIEVVRRPAPGVFTCLGGGYPASGTPALPPSVWLPEGAALTPFEGAGEVQTPVRYAGPEPLAPGEPVVLRHAKAGELCERFTQLQWIEGGQLLRAVNTYRGDGQCFL